MSREESIRAGTRPVTLRIRSLVFLGLLTMSCGCASAPPAPAGPIVSFEQKMAWMLQLENERVIRVEPPAPPEAIPVRGRRRTQPHPAGLSSPDLNVLIKDAEPRVRRRAALAMGRVGLPSAAPALVATLADPEPDVRAMAAFGLGLLGDPAAEASLTPLLSDPSPVVRGRAAEALGLVGAKGAAAAIGKMAGEFAGNAAVTAMQPDDETWPAAAEAEAFKLALFALVRLRAFEPLAAAVLKEGHPISGWWPIAYALQRIEDKRAASPLIELLAVKGRYTPAFAARGLGVLKDTSAADAITRLIDPRTLAPLEVIVSALRAAGQIGAAGAAESIARLIADHSTPANVRIEATTTLGALRAVNSLPIVQDLLTDEWPALRAAALQAAAAIDQENFLFILSGLEPDRDWRVRAALATVLGTLPRDVAIDRARSMLQDEDKRVIPSVLTALARLRAPDLAAILLERLKDPDFVVRMAAARHIGDLRPEGGAEALRQAYKVAESDSAYGARAAAIEALAAYGASEAPETLKAALTDKDWAVRIRAAELLAKLEPTAETRAAIRPAPGSPLGPYDDPLLIAPAYSPHVFIETAKGVIEFELAVVDAPDTSRNFVTLARKGFFNGLQIHRVVPNFVVQDGDPRGDGEGGPGYSIRDELNDRPYLRGTVGMALDWRDTGGSQFFITHSPQPHLDAKYTAFGHVVNGMDVVDRIQQGDVIQRIRIWDGKGWIGGETLNSDPSTSSGSPRATSRGER